MKTFRTLDLAIEFCDPFANAKPHFVWDDIGKLNRLRRKSAVDVRPRSDGRFCLEP